ncbi:hypothetical protein M91_21665 [Bos mutus]|uniref:Uncharacterized protein n=1 Tax=Bos mutus TaxID=72004 RepID=L8HTC9_9CETA|nr:hypothetical protein M91_21665 [Bos mutus]
MRAESRGFPTDENTILKAVRPVTSSNSDISVDRSADMSPASSTTSLPVSPLAEEPLPFKDIMKDECSMLKLQLKEKDELISQLQEELDAARSVVMLSVHRVALSPTLSCAGEDRLYPVHWPKRNIQVI